MSDTETLQSALNEAWAELERKQGYLEASVQESARLQGELDVLRQQTTSSTPADDAEVSRLKAALEEAWAELNVKQGYLENAFQEIEKREEELKALRDGRAVQDEMKARPAPSPAQLQLDEEIRIALAEAWAGLERGEDEALSLRAEKATLEQQIEDLKVENKALKEAFGLHKMTQ